MKTRSRNTTASSSNNVSKKKESAKTTPLTNNKPVKKSTPDVKTPFAEISNTIHRNESVDVRDNSNKKLSNAVPPSEYSDSPILVSRFKKTLENKLPGVGRCTNQVEKVFESAVLDDLASPIIKTRKIKCTSSTESIPSADFDKENSVTSKGNKIKVRRVGDKSISKDMNRTKIPAHLTDENVKEIKDTPAFDSLPPITRRSVRNRNKTAPSVKTPVNNVKGPSKTKVIKKEEKIVIGKVTKAKTKSNLLARNTGKSNDTKNQTSDKKATKCGIPKKVMQNGIKEIKSRKNSKKSLDIVKSTVKDISISENISVTHQNTSRVKPKNMELIEKSQKLNSECSKVNENKIEVDPPNPPTKLNSSHKTQPRLSKREQLAQDLREGKLKSALIPNSSNNETLVQPTLISKMGSKSKKDKTSALNTKKLSIRSKTKSVILPKVQNHSRKKVSVDGKSPKVSLPGSVAEGARKAPIYLGLPKSPAKRKVLKTRKSISDAYDLTIESDATPNPIVKKKKPKPRNIKSKVVPKKQKNKFTVLTTDPNFEKHFPFAVKSFYGKSDATSKYSSLVDSTPLCDSDVEDCNDNFDVPHDDPHPEVDQSGIISHPPTNSEEHVLLQPSDSSRNSNKTFNASLGSNKSTPEGIRQMSKMLLGTSTPFSNKMSSPTNSITQQPVKTVTEDIESCFGFEEADGEEEELIGLSLPLIKNIQHLFASTGNYSTDCIENNSKISKPNVSNKSNWSVSQIENEACSSPKLRASAAGSIKNREERNNLDSTCLFEDIEDEMRVEKSKILTQFKSVENKRRDEPEVVMSPEKSFVMSPEKSFVIPANKVYDRQSLDASRAAFIKKFAEVLPTDDEDEDMSQDESEELPIKKKITEKNQMKTKGVKAKKNTQSTKVTKNSKRKMEKESALSTTAASSNSTMNVSKKFKRNEKNIQDWASSLMDHFSEIDESALLVE